MKKSYFLSFSGLLFLWVIIHEISGAAQVAGTVSIAAGINQQYLTHLADFEAAVTALEAETNRLSGQGKSVATLRQSFQSARLQFKRIEFLVSYLDPEFVTDNINGAPLQKLERNAPTLRVLEPKGFQVMEELVFSKRPLEHKEELQKLAQALHKNAQSLVQYQRRIQLTDRHIFEAVRGAFIRVISLGVTGFDSPVALQSLPEALVVMQSTHQAMQAYYPVLEKQAPGLREKLEEQFAGSIAYLT